MENWYCKYCNKSLKLKNKYTKSGHLARCSEYIYYIDNSLSEQILHKMYVVEKKSLTEIQLLFNLSSVSPIVNRLKRYNIHTRSISDATSSDKCRDKRKKTNFERYGVEHNLSKNSYSRKSMEDKLLKEEGIVNVFQRKDVKNKIKETNLERYGVENAAQSQEVRRKQRNTMRKNKVFTRDSKPEDNIYNILCDTFGENDVVRHVELNNWDIDFYIKSKKYYIQFDGSYWHGLDRPLEDVINNKTRQGICIYKTYLRDREQDNYCNLNSINMLRIKEKTKKEDIISLIKLTLMPKE